MTQIARGAVLVTGGGNGIGKAIAASLAGAGAKVMIADLDETVAKAAAEDIRAAGGEADGIGCDVTRDGAFEALKKRIEERFGSLHILVNCAGTILSGLPQEIPISEWQRMMDVNFMAVIRANHVFLPGMIERGAGHIVNIASFAGLYPYAFDRLPYAACKAALVSLSEGLALYLKPQGIGVTCLCPGPVIGTAIMARSRVWSEGLDVRGPGPQFAAITPDKVGSMAVEAIEQARFFVPTHPEVRELMKLRAVDPDAFIDRQIAAPHIVVPAKGKVA